MAQGNLCVVADRISRLLGSEDNIEMGSLLGVSQELLMELEETISKALAPKFLDAVKRRFNNFQLSRWLTKLEDAVYDAENLLEDLSTRALWRRSMTTNAGKKKILLANIQVRNFFSTSALNMPYSPLNLRQDIKGIKERLDRIAAECGAFDSDQNPSDEGVLITREESKKEIIELEYHLLFGNLWDCRTEYHLLGNLWDYWTEKVSFHAIVGVDGIGRTTIARDLFNDKRVQSNFQVTIWVDVPNNFDPKEILTEIVVRATSHQMIDPDPSMERLQSLLSDSISFKRCLIVLDDMGNNEDLGKWKSLIDILEKVGSLCYGTITKIIVTTTSMGVAISIGCNLLSCPLQILDEEQSWILFKKVVGQDPKTAYHIQVGRDIVNKCMGLSIVVMAIGRMLSFKSSEEEWRFMLNEESLDERLSGIFRMYDYIIHPMLKLSYDQLPSPLKPCFAYCNLFPEDYEIDVQTLIKLWIAQGFTEPSSIPGKSLEDTGYEYFSNLLERFFFQEAEKDVRGRVTKCKMHKLARDLARHVAKNQCNILSSPSTCDGIGQTFHVAFHYDLFSAKDIPNPSIHEEKVRSILLPCQSRREHRGIPDNAICSIIISRFRCLRALDLHDLGIKIVPNSIGKLKFLKYLDLSQNEDITELPNSITNLVNLQTLKLSSCFGLKKLPRGFKNLINLRHLEIDGCYNLTGVLRGIRRLSNLQTLSQLIVSEETSVRDGTELNEVTSQNKTLVIDKFHIKNLEHGRDDIHEYLELYPGARSLSLEWETRAPMSGIEQTPLDSELFSSVKELSLYGFRGNKLFHDGFPSNLVKLSLWRCVNCEILPPLHQLRSLMVLVLDEMPKLEYISENTSSSTTITFFPSLKELWLIDLPELKGWWKNGVNNNDDCPQSFYCLSKLLIENCHKLDSMPLFPTLEEGLVMDSTCWEPFQLTMSMSMKLQDEASSSSSPLTPLSSSPLSKLKSLCFVGIDDFSARLIAWDMLKSLRYLRFDCVRNLATLPYELQQVTSLEELHVWRSDLEEIPKWIGQLKKLRKLVIQLCPNLNLLPQEINSLLKSNALEIKDCPALLR